MDNQEAVRGGASASGVPDLPSDRAELQYRWPDPDAFQDGVWTLSEDGRSRVRAMPESEAELAIDSRWPAFFPSALCLATVSDGGVGAIEKVVGASIVNRFPFVLMLSFCRQPLSSRHHVRRTFMDLVESSGRVAVQFLLPGPALHKAMSAIAEVPEDRPGDRLNAAARRYRKASHSDAPVLSDAYLVYEGRLVRPGTDFEGNRINDCPWHDVGSHRCYFFEIDLISLREDIASAATPLQWRSLPTWSKSAAAADAGAAEGPDGQAKADARREVFSRLGYTKTYRPDYVFPAGETVAFAGQPAAGGFSTLELPPLPEDQVEVDNDRARWPCFFPSSLGLITVRTDEGKLGAFPCGSTTVVSRSPMTIAICVSYGRINVRYAPRSSLELLREAGRFCCGVAPYDPRILSAIGYLGNVSLRDDPDKVMNSGLTISQQGDDIIFDELPIWYVCRIREEILLGTHAMFLGEVEQIHARADLTAQDPLVWCPWAGTTKP